MRQRQRERPRDNEKHRINEAIEADEVRVVTEDGEQLGVLSLADAIAKAEESGMDLVEVAASASPPVCRILDYGKLKYKEQKKAAETRKRSSTTVVKELRIRYRTDTHDLNTKLRKARKFLESGDRVRFQMRFRGREVVYRDLGVETFNQVAEELADIASIEDRSPLLNNRMMITFVPKSNAKPAEASE
jgi:translation initiation factor IF-3